MEQLDLFSAMQGEDQERKEYTELVKKLNHFAELYYSKDEPEISDYEYYHEQQAQGDREGAS